MRKKIFIIVSLEIFVEITRENYFSDSMCNILKNKNIKNVNI